MSDKDGMKCPINAFLKSDKPPISLIWKRKMATRTRSKWKPDNSGQYVKQIGWKRSGDRYIQHKFRLGTDLKSAQLRELRLQELWRQIEATTSAGQHPTWVPHTLDFAKQIAKGSPQVALRRLPKDDETAYARWLHRVQNHYPMLAIVPQDPLAYQTGKAINYAKANEELYATVTEIRQRQLKYGTITEMEIFATSGTLHQAFDAYMQHIKSTVIDVPNPKPHGNTRYNCVERLKERHTDVALETINLDRIQEMLDYWRARPKVKNRDKSIARKTAIHHVGELLRFFKWLHKSDQFKWRKPDDFSDLDRKVDWTKAEIQSRETAEQVATWSLDELTTLYTYATPVERVVLLLGLNCGFGAAEQGTIFKRQIYFDHVHPRAVRFKLGKPADFIKRIRLKSNVYGEHLLWPHTVMGLKWLLGRQSSDLLFTTAKGKPYWTTMGRGTQRFGKLWNDLIDRVQRDKPQFRRLSFGKLRKTSGDLIREFSSGETMRTFHCRGKPVSGDEHSEVYTNKPFGKVFKAIKRVEDHLAPMFAAVADPFADHRKSYMGRTKTQLIVEMYDAGTPLAEIMSELDVALSTIYRTLEAHGRQTTRNVKKPR